MIRLILLSFVFAYALDPVGIAIDQAQGLAVKKNRKEACEILQRQLRETPGNAKARAKVLESLNHISRMFFTDKGQKEFEAGQASMWETPDIALTHLKTALATEDDNIQVLSAIARIQLMKQDCEGATQSLASARKINNYASEPAILELRALACQQRFLVLRENAKAISTTDKWEEAYIQYLLAQDSIQQQNWKKAFDALLKISEEYPQFPESYFLLSKAGDELDKDTEAWLQKYVSLCKAVSGREKRRFSLEPKLCANQKEAEDELVQKAKSH